MSFLLPNEGKSFEEMSFTLFGDDDGSECSDMHDAVFLIDNSMNKAKAAGKP